MLRFGIIGTNFISEWFIQGCQHSAGRAEPVAVMSRERSRAEAFATKNGLAHGVDSLDELFELVDAVYVATPHFAHHDQAVAAIAAGRHVLVEKTMAASAAEVRNIFDSAAEAGVVAMEAMRSLHTPAHQVIKQQAGELGTLRHARIEKYQYSSRYDAFRSGVVLNAFDPEMGNTALADIGVYCLQPAIDLFGPPRSATGVSLWLDNGFEGGGSMVLGHGDLVVDVTWSKVVAGLGPSVIHGEDATLIFDDPGETSEVLLQPRGGAPVVLWSAPKPKPAETMHHEIMAFCDQVDAGRTEPRWSQVSLITRELMDAHLARTTAQADSVS